MLLRAQCADCNFRLSHLSKWKFMHGHRTNDNERKLGSGPRLGLELGLSLGHQDGDQEEGERERPRERSREFGLPTQSTEAACAAFNALFTLDCLMKESLHSFIRFIHSFNSFASLLDSFMRRRTFLCFFSFCLCLSAAVVSCHFYFLFLLLFNVCLIN